MAADLGRITQINFLKAGTWVEKHKTQIETDQNYSRRFVINAIKRDIGIELSTEQLKRVYDGLEIKPICNNSGKTAGMAKLYNRIAALEKMILALHAAMQANGFVGTDPADPLKIREFNEIRDT